MSLGCSISSVAHREQLEAAIEFAREGDIVDNVA
jgi:hypothetical protein